LSNIPIIDFIVETIEKHGGACMRLAPRTAEKPICWHASARCGGRGDFIGHTDVVPIGRASIGIRSRSFLPSMAESYMGAVHPT